MKKILFVIGIILLICGMACVIIKGLTPTYIDSNGMLTEHFFLLPIGFFGIGSGAILCFLSKIVKSN